MRFKTRYDAWLMIVMSIVALEMIVLPCVFYFTHIVRGAPMLLFLIGPMIVAFAFSLTLPQYYELRDDGMFIRQGWKRAVLPYGALRELRPETSVTSARVLSTHRIYITVVPADKWVIAVAEEKRFLAEVRCRAPQLQRGSGGST